MIEIERPEDVAEAYAFAEKGGLLPDETGDGPYPVWVMGGGANTIGRDEGFDGVILINRITGIDVVHETEDELVIKAYGGEVWDDVVRFTTERGYSGIEAMAAIPGTMGAAPVQNIGAYGQEVSQVITEVEAYDNKVKKIITLTPEEMNFEYRVSIFNRPENKGRYFIIAVTLKLSRSTLQPPFYTSLQKYVDEHNETDFSPENIRRMVTEVRAGKLPDPKKEASAGSFFKNVYLDATEAELARKKGIQVWEERGDYVVNSGWLIEECGLKGQVLHGMRVSDKAALVLINESASTYADLAAARDEIREKVREKFGFELEQEPMEIA